MCGIAGILSTTLGSSEMRAAAERMQTALTHRGPDDKGIWQSKCGRTALAHSRLAILDLSNGGHQPMSSPDGRLTICFNGEIYNFKALRADMERNGTLFSTTSDTEVILRLYERDGPDCVKQLRGMFAFAIWDESTRTAFIARDAMGIKPLYIFRSSTSLAFASELRALAQSGIFTPSVNTHAVRLYLESGSVPEPHTLLNDVIALEAGQTLEWHEGKSASHSYWHVHFDNIAPVRSDPVAHTREALLDSVRHHFVSDVPVGVFLSAGIDSTALLALANATGHRGINAFCIAVDDPNSDESQTAKRTAKHFDAHYHEMRLDAEAAQNSFARFLTHIDQPTIDGFNTFTVSALARHHGLKVVLSGLGGDELFAGYASFRQIPSMLRWRSLLRNIPGGIAAASLMLQGQPRGRRMLEFLQSSGSPSDAFTSLRAIFSHAEAAKVARWAVGLDPVADSATKSVQRSATIADEISRLELTRYMRNQLLRDSDVMSMAHGLELRVPFVDRQLFEAVAGIPAKTRLQQGKRLLVDAVPELPEWVTRQKKRGFLFPYQKWLGSTWGEQFDRATQGCPVPTPNWYQRWSIFVLQHSLKGMGITP